MTRILLMLVAVTFLSGGLLTGCASDGDGYASWSKRDEPVTPLKKRTDRGGGLSGN